MYAATQEQESVAEDDNPRICIPLSTQRWIQNMSRPSNHCAESLSKRHGKAIDDHACLGSPIYIGLDGKAADFFTDEMRDLQDRFQEIGSHSSSDD